MCTHHAISYACFSPALLSPSFLALSLPLLCAVWLAPVRIMHRHTTNGQGMPRAECPPRSENVQPPPATGLQLLPSASLEYGPNSLSFY